MFLNRKSIIFATLLLSLLGLCKSHGEEPISFDNLEIRLSQLEEHSFHGKRYNPGAAKAYGLTIGADALYWQARENGIPYVIEIVNPLDALIHPPRELKSHVIEFDFDWDFGVRVEGGLQFHRDNWRILGTWTHFDTKAHDHGFTKSLKAYQPIWADPRFFDFPDFVSRVEAKWQLFFNQADLMFSRAFYMGKYFILEPAVGGSGIWIDQHLRTDYKRALIAGDSHTKLENDFKGVGVRTGLDTRFCFRHGISIFNMTYLGLYYGKFELSRKEHFTTDALPPRQIRESVHNSFWQVSPLVAMQMGLRWDHGFSENRHAVSVKLAYEYQLLFSQNQFLRIIDPAPKIIENQGDLALMGGTFSVLVTF